MNRQAFILPLLALCILSSGARAEPLPSNKAGAIAYLTKKQVRITKDANGHAIRLMSQGKPVMTVEEYQLIGKLTHLEQMGLNSAPLKEGEWGFLKKLPKLKRLAIWHGHKFATLKPFCGLRVESLTIGGCMGLRDLNKDNPDQLRNAIKTLRDLPNVKTVNLYHSPLAPDDSHLAHLVSQFPSLEEIKIDFAAPRGSQTTITPAGLAKLQKLKLTVLHVENAHSFTAEHFKSIAGIKSLKALLVEARRKAMPTEGLIALRKLRPDIDVVVAQPGDESPPHTSREPVKRQ